MVLLLASQWSRVSRRRCYESHSRRPLRFQDNVWTHESWLWERILRSWFQNNLSNAFYWWMQYRNEWCIETVWSRIGTRVQSFSQIVVKLRYILVMFVSWRNRKTGASGSGRREQQRFKQNTQICIVWHRMWWTDQSWFTGCPRWEISHPMHHSLHVKVLREEKMRRLGSLGKGWWSNRFLCLLLIKFLVFIETLFLDPIILQKMTGRTIDEFFMLLDKVGPLLARVSTKNPDVSKLRHDQENESLQSCNNF